MVTAKYNASGGDKCEMSFKGLSTDTKPTVSYNGLGIENGSSFFEIDTQNLVFYDGRTDSWLEN